MAREQRVVAAHRGGRLVKKIVSIFKTPVAG
jgi:hypothetical protein